MTEPIDQATKDLIEKEAEDYAHAKEISLSTAYFCRYRGYIAGATVWSEKLKQLETQSHDQVRIIEHLEQELAKEREVNKQLMKDIANVKILLEIERKGI